LINATQEVFAYTCVLFWMREQVIKAFAEPEI
jgi:hypothetical protein